MELTANGDSVIRTIVILKIPLKGGGDGAGAAVLAGIVVALAGIPHGVSDNVVLAIFLFNLI